jgi:hypothetical protein
MTRKPLIRALPEQDVALLEKLLRQRKTYDQIARHLRCSVSRVDHYACHLAKSETAAWRVTKIEP